MTKFSLNPDNKVAVALANGGPGQPPTIILGVPTAAWEYMQDGKTHTFDLSSAGIPVQIMMFGAADREGVMDLLEKASQMISGRPLENKPKPGEPLRDLGIKDPTAH